MKLSTQYFTKMMARRKRCANCKSFMYPGVLGDGYCAMHNKKTIMLACCDDFVKAWRRRGKHGE